MLWVLITVTSSYVILKSSTQHKCWEKKKKKHDKIFSAVKEQWFTDNQVFHKW